MRYALHPTHQDPTAARQRRQQGSVAVEFALVASIFFALLFGAFEVARVMWIMNAASDTTYYGARLAAVCPSLTSSELLIKRKLVGRLPGLDTGNITFVYSPNRAAPDLVTVSLNSYQVSTFIPFIDFSPFLPSASTTLPYEYRTTLTENPDCR